MAAQIAEGNSKSSLVSLDAHGNLVSLYPSCGIQAYTSLLIIHRIYMYIIHTSMYIYIYIQHITVLHTPDFGVQGKGLFEL